MFRGLQKWSSWNCGGGRSDVMVRTVQRAVSVQCNLCFLQSKVESSLVLGLLGRYYILSLRPSVNTFLRSTFLTKWKPLRDPLQRQEFSQCELNKCLEPHTRTSISSLNTMICGMYSSGTSTIHLPSCPFKSYMIQLDGSWNSISSTRGQRSSLWLSNFPWIVLALSWWRCISAFNWL